MKPLTAALLPFLLACASAGQSRAGLHLGVEGCLFLEAPGAGVAAVVNPDAAGRVVFYGFAGENILWEPVDRASGKPRPTGGFGLDIGPEMRQIPDHPVLWRNKYRGEIVGEGTVRVASEPCPVLGVKISKTLRMSGTGAIDLEQRMENVSSKDQSYCFWDRTLCSSGGYTLIPLNPKSRFPAKWVLGKRLSPTLWEYNGKDPAHDQMKVLDGVLVVKSIGKEQKVGADSDAGWIAYTRGTQLFVKYYPYTPGGSYTDGGLSVAHYYNENLAELEPISAEAKLKPGEGLDFPQRWTIVRLDREVKSPEEARALVSRIPPSPFR